MVNKGYERYIGKKVRNYTILQELGSGGSAHVYLARSCLNKPVAIKLLAPEYRNAENQQHFLREARFLQELQPHLYILPFLEYGEIEGIPYLVTEYASRGTLRTYINTCHSISVEKALAILIQIGEAINTVHQHHIVHCDIKPENVLFNDKGDAILADFGIAVRLEEDETFSGLARGTYAYMAPEQFDGMFTKASDQYSLGCIAYELLTGKHPFEYFIPFDPLNRELMRRRHQSARLLPLRELNTSVPSHVERAILQSMAKNASERHPSIASFTRLLQSSIPSPSVLSNHYASPLDTPPSSPSDTDENLSSTTNPPRNPAPSSAKVAVVHKLDRPENVFYKETHKAFYENLPVQSFPDDIDKDRKVNKDRLLHTEPPSLPTGVSNIHGEDIQSGKRIFKKDLDDLRLRQNSDLFKKLSSLLKGFKLSLIDHTLEHPYLKEVRRECTLIRSQKSKCEIPHLYLFYIPYQSLTASRENIENLLSLGLIIPEEATYIIFSDCNTTLGLIIGDIINNKWKDNKRYVEFIPPNHLDELQDMPNAAKRKWLIDKLHLKDALEERQMSKSVQLMDGNDFFTLVDIICKKFQEYTDSGARGWRSLLDAASLNTLASEIERNGATRPIAIQLIEHLKIRAPLPEKPQYEVLGLLLLELLNAVTLTESEYKSLTSIIRKYRLVPELQTLPTQKT